MAKGSPKIVDPITRRLPSRLAATAQGCAFFALSEKRDPSINYLSITKLANRVETHAIALAADDAIACRTISSRVQISCMLAGRLAGVIRQHSITRFEKFSGTRGLSSCG